MKNRKIIVLLIFLTIILASNIVLAAFDPVNNITISIEKANEVTQGYGTSIFETVSKIGIICSVIALMILGIKYMLGSVEEKAEYKKSFGIYILGASLVFAISTIVNLIYSIVKSAI